ncbi:uncharacterized protein METZ01_LOCUS43239 [marine metagenome]|uniref:Uncharacterized protein n=1 Tax=marine metagenome TaxID=408172 RepID=A0A381RF15_9ZZZZ
MQELDVPSVTQLKVIASSEVSKMLIHHGRISNRNESLPALNTSVIYLPAFPWK